MKGVWIKRIVTPQQLEEIRNAEFIELRLETVDGTCGEVHTFYAATAVYRTLQDFNKKS